MIYICFLKNYDFLLITKKNIYEAKLKKAEAKKGKK